MNKSDDDIRNELYVVESFHIDKAMEHLKNHEFLIHEYFAQCVASVCDVDKDKMLSDCNTIYVAQARWLYWYAYRYMTSETYEKIAENTERLCGKRFTKQGVASSVNKMSLLIESEPMWKKRWTIIKRIIKLYDTNGENNNVDNTIVIQIPKELKDKINITIKEK